MPFFVKWYSILVMEFAVIFTGGKQYVVKPGDTIRVEKLAEASEAKEGDKIVFDKVMLVDDGSSTSVGTPYIEGAKVLANFIKAVRAKKVTGVKYKPKARTRKTFGHKQHLSEVKIEKIN